MAESILHFGAVTLKVNGTGTLRMSLIGLDEVRTYTLNTLTMQTAPGKEPTVLANFNSQRARLRMKTTAIDEYMRIDRVIIWIKELATSYPNGGR